MELPRPDHRFANIEVLRGIAVLMVLFQHLPMLLPGTYGWWAPSGWLGRLNFSAGVDIFFCISGFVVARTLRRDLRGLRFRESFQHTFRFWARRAFRLWPAAWVGLFVALLLAEAFNRSGAMDVASSLRLIPAGMGMYVDFLAIHDAHHQRWMGTMGQYWSLSLEEQFYAVLPPILILLRRATLPFLLFYALAWWMFLPSDLATAVFLRPGCLIAGVILSYCEGARFWMLLSRVKLSMSAKAIGCGILCGLAAYGEAIRFDDKMFGVAVFWFNPAMVTAICFVLVLGAAVEETAAPPSRLGRALIFTGSRSYVLYILHPLAYAMAREIAFRIAPDLQDGVLQSTLLILLALVLLFGSTELVVRFVEQPMRRLGRRLTGLDRLKPAKPAHSRADRIDGPYVTPSLNNRRIAVKS